MPSLNEQTPVAPDLLNCTGRSLFHETYHDDRITDPDMTRLYSKIRTVLRHTESTPFLREIEDLLEDAISAFARTTNSTGQLLLIMEYLTYLEQQIIIYYEGSITREYGNLSMSSRSSSSQEIANTPEENSSLVAPMGLELTYHAPIKKEKLSSLIEGGPDRELNFTYENDNIIATNGVNSVSANVPQGVAPGVVSRIIGNELSGNLGTTAASLQDSAILNRLGNDLKLCHETLLPELEVHSDDRYGTEEEADECLERLEPMPLVASRQTRDIYYYTERIKKYLADEGLNGFGSKVYRDCGNAIEVCTPVHKTWESMEEWFIKTDAFAKKNGLLSWKRTSGGGGMHVNISYNKTVPNWTLAYTNFFILIANHPELNWIFNEPSDNHTANAFVRHTYFIKPYHEMTKSDYKLTDKIWEKFQECNGKQYAINVKDSFHFELRTFEMVRSVKDLEVIVKLVNGMLKYCMELASRDVMLKLEIECPVSFMGEAEERGYILNEQPIMIFEERMMNAVSSFNKLVKLVGMDPTSYRKFIQRNLYKRRKAPYGKKFMV